LNSLPTNEGVDRHRRIVCALALVSMGRGL
jgi:hypothetical protein